MATIGVSAKSLREAQANVEDWSKGGLQHGRFLEAPKDQIRLAQQRIAGRLKRCGDVYLDRTDLDVANMLNR